MRESKLKRHVNTFFVFFFVVKIFFLKRKQKNYKVDVLAPGRRLVASGQYVVQRAVWPPLPANRTSRNQLLTMVAHTLNTTSFCNMLDSIIRTSVETDLVRCSLLLR